jgi:hypothetical protein
MAIAALSFRISRNFLLLAELENKNIAFEHEGNNKKINSTSTNNRKLLKTRKDRPTITITALRKE